MHSMMKKELSRYTDFNNFYNLLVVLFIARKERCTLSSPEMLLV